MDNNLDEIYRLIPHRPPFLWVDRIISCQKGKICTEKCFPETLEFFTGHFPDHPIVPGVILCEAVFQSGALLFAKTSAEKDALLKGVPVLTRIGTTKFKRSVLPGDTVSIEVLINETLSGVFYCTGKVNVHDKLAVKTDFSCTFTTNLS